MFLLRGAPRSCCCKLPASSSPKPLLTLARGRTSGAASSSGDQARASVAMATTDGAIQSIEPLAQTPLAVASAALAAGDLPLPAELADYRPNVSVLLVSPRTRRAFCATRVDDPYRTWQCPQGGIDPGDETALQAALRELEEETAIRSVRVAGATGWLAYDFPDWVRAKLRPGMLKYKGQAQRWFLMIYTGDPGTFGENEQVAGLAEGQEEDDDERRQREGCAEVDLSGGAGSHREFSAWAWRPLARLPLDVSEFKRGVYASAAAELGAVLDELEASGALQRLAEEAAAGKTTARL